MQVHWRSTVFAAVFLVLLCVSWAPASLADSKPATGQNQVDNSVTVGQSATKTKTVHELSASHEVEKPSGFKAIFLKEFHSPLHAIPSNSR